MTARRVCAPGAILAAGMLWLGLCAPARALLPPQMHTVAGGGSCTTTIPSGDPNTPAMTMPCDGVKATSVPIVHPRGVSLTPDGGYLYVDTGERLVRQVSPTGIVTTVAGNGSSTDAPDGTVATQSGLDDPVAAAALPGGGFLVTEFHGSVVRLVTPGDPGTATISTVAGTGTPGNSGLGGAATQMKLNYPSDAEPTADGRVLIADTYSGLIRVLSAAAPGATLDTVAGGGSCDDASGGCEGAPASSVILHRPVAIAALADGTNGYLIAEADSAVSAIRRVADISTTALFATVAGGGWKPGFGGDGGPAVNARLADPQGVVALPTGEVVIADTGNERVREIATDGTIATIAGSGVAGSTGDGGDATAAAMQSPNAVAPRPGGGWLISDSDNGEIRAVVNPPVTTINPGAPNGSNGWWIGVGVPVTIKSKGGKGIRCALDPSSPPPVYDALPPSCDYSGAAAGTLVYGNGTHTIYAAAINSFGDKESPVSVSFRLDTAPPTITCEKKPTVTINDPNAIVRARVSDEVSGVMAPRATAPIDTSVLGPGTQVITAADVAGNNSLASCPYVVVPERFRPSPDVRAAFRIVPGGTAVRRMSVVRVARRAAVTVSCAARHGCPFSLRRAAACRGRACTKPHHVDLSGLIGTRPFPPGTTLTVSVTRADTVGRVFVFTVRDRRPPVLRRTCLAPGAKKAGRQCT